MSDPQDAPEECAHAKCICLVCTETVDYMSRCADVECLEAQYASKEVELATLRARVAELERTYVEPAIDWAQAPEWAQWWGMLGEGRPHWCRNEPSWRVSDRDNVEAPTFGFLGDWRASKRKRPA